jgi:predicted NAD/FAD-binding protein
MRSFPRLSLLYSTWATVVKSTGNVTIRTSHEVTRVKRTSKQVDLTFREVEEVDLGQQIVGPKEEQQGVFDELIMCTDADAALKVLGQDASWMEKKVLGNVKVGLDLHSLLWSTLR